MSLTRTVPAAVPSLFHSSTPCVPSSAAKNSVPFTFVRSLGYELRLPGLMSLTRTVPAAVPSLFHSSDAVRAVVGREEQRAVDVRRASSGTTLALPGLMSLTRTVPAAVPSLFHSSDPFVPSLAAKNSVPLTFVRSG